jgi:dihydrodipicolinate synthase/N-acetylneuraminate lyase
VLTRCRIVVAPAYYAFVYGKDKNALKEFFVSIADESPLPLLIYNVPSYTRFL